MDQSEGGKTETNVSQRSGHDMPMTVVKIILLLFVIFCCWFENNYVKGINMRPKPIIPFTTMPYSSGLCTELQMRH